jgi:quercetin dioxygenase-like cupin family protein
VFHELGAEVVAVGNEPDGININAGVGATHPEYLQAAVLEHGADLGVALVGDVPSGLPTFGIPSPSLMLEHADTAAVAAVALMLIGFSQTAGDARAFAAKHRYQIDVNQESVAQSAANIGSGVLHGMPVSTSLSASSLNDHSGAKTGLASITSGVTVLLTLLFLAPLFSQLPKPVLGALIIEAVVMGMMNLPEMRRIYRVQKFDFWVAVAAILGTLVFGVLAGVVIGIGLSLIWLVAVATHPDMPALGRETGTQVFRSLAEHEDDEPVRRRAEARVTHRAGIRRRFLVEPGDFGSVTFTVTEVEMDPGATDAWHVHPGAEHALVVFQGRGTIAVGDVEETLEPLKGIRILPGRPHRVTNDSRLLLRYFVCASPGTQSSLGSSRVRDDSFSIACHSSAI